MTWQMRLYKSSKPQETYVSFEDDKVLFITPTNEDYQARVRIYKNRKEQA